jgi:hypothetical protein
MYSAPRVHERFPQLFKEKEVQDPAGQHNIIELHNIYVISLQKNIVVLAKQLSGPAEVIGTAHLL